jgi:hypothetical protein
MMADASVAGDYEMDGLMAQMADERAAYGAPMGAAKRSRAPPPAAPRPSATESLSTSANVQTKTVEMGEFFKYDIETPVTVKRGQSAMVPILQTKITCQKEHVYNNQKMPKNPVVTMRVNNDTGAVLERGPILVLDEGTYVGEAILPYTTVGGENHIAYSVDLGVVVNEEYKNGGDLKVISIAKKYFHKEYLDWKECEYEVQNKKTEEIDLVIEHPKSNYKVDEDATKKPTEETENYYRWKFKVQPKTTSKFKVRELYTRVITEYIKDVGFETLKSYYNNNYISKRDFKDIEEIINLQRDINKLKRNNNALENERNQIYNEQSRLRQNLESLGSTTREEKLRVKYVDKLDRQEQRLEDIKKKIKSNNDNIKSLEKKIDKKLDSLR